MLRRSHALLCYHRFATAQIEVSTCSHTIQRRVTAAGADTLPSAKTLLQL